MIRLALALTLAASPALAVPYPGDWRELSPGVFMNVEGDPAPKGYVHCEAWDVTCGAKGGKPPVHVKRPRTPPLWACPEHRERFKTICVPEDDPQPVPLPLPGLLLAGAIAAIWRMKR